MKIILSSVLSLIVVITPNMVFAEGPDDKSTSRVYYAQLWDQFDIAFKTVLIGGLIVGYRSGIETGAASEHRRLNNNNVKSRFEATKIISKTEALFPETLDFYVDKTDDFLKRYPVCKKMRLSQLLVQLASVWTVVPLREQMGYDFIRVINYEDVKEACLTKPE